MSKLANAGPLEMTELLVKKVRESGDEDVVRELRGLCIKLIERSHDSWLIAIEDLVRTRMSDCVKEQKDTEKCLEFLQRMEASRLNNDSFRALMTEFAQTCSSFNICFLASGLAAWMEYFRSGADTGVEEAFKQARAYAAKILR